MKYFPTTLSKAELFIRATAPNEEFSGLGGLGKGFEGRASDRIRSNPKSNSTFSCSHSIYCILSSNMTSNLKLLT